MNFFELLKVVNFRVKVSEDGKKALLTLAKGDMRKVLNVLQSTWLAYKDVTEDNVYTCVGHPLTVDIENIVKWLLNDNFKTVYISILSIKIIKKRSFILQIYYLHFLNSFVDIKELKTIKGLALSDILTEVHAYVHRSKLF